ncbi:MAG: hypothetical protein IPI46_13880 [Bacteroidetes bacterium]|nr:hypothetical protein [Bacteroidota bacterium]
MKISIIKYITALKGIYILLSLLLPQRCFAQPGNNIPVPTSSGIINTPDPLPADYSSNALGGKRNFMRIYVLKYPEQNVSQINMTLALNQINVSTEYFDGLGRSLQSVQKKGSSSTKDLVQTKVYDAFGRVSTQYLPYASTTNLGKFKESPFSELNSFYNTQSFAGTGTYVNDKIRYSKVEYDNSPLNRPLVSFAPGNSWVGLGITNEYETNVSNEVQIWNVIADEPLTSITYASGELSKETTTDEDQGKVVVYKDKGGKLIMQSRLEKIVGTTPIYLKTYYVYDDLDQLRFVIPPLAVEQLQGSLGWIPTTDLLNELCFQYIYDERGRMIEKKIPGKDWEHLIYDKEDRIVLSQDGNLRLANQWNFIIYDQLGRTKLTGLFNSASTRQVLQDLISNSITATPADEFYTTNWLTDYGKGLYQYPQSLIDAEILTYTYYDKFQGSGIYASFDGSYVSNLPTGLLYAETPNASNMMHGQVTGSSVKIINPGTLVPWINSNSFYDKKGRVIQTKQGNAVSGIDITTSMYDFSNKILASYIFHNNPIANLPLSGSSMYNTSGILNRYNYDYLGRLTNIYSNVNNLGEMPIVYNQYDALGRLSNKHLGGSTENQVFSYNLRGLLTGINPDWVKTTNPSWTNYFGEILCYDQGFAQPRYNGNIAGVLWRGAEVNKGQRAYGYNYDYTNRLTHAEFRENAIVSNSWTNTWTKNDLDFTVSNILYDANGNIQTMNQRGPGSTNPVDMDVLDYSYKTIGSIPTNQLATVTDNTTDNITNNGSNHDFKDGTNTSDDYEYDVNGNLISDINKDINSITYTYLNKPELINFGNGNTITYIYDATGNKLRKIAIDQVNGEEVLTDYINGHIYKTTNLGGNSTSELEYIIHDEGRIRPMVTSSLQESYTYDFFVKDHLGNVRATVNAVPTTGVPSVLDYIATMEPEWQPQEEELFDDMGNVISYRPGGTDPGNTRCIVLHGDDPARRIGTSMMLRVMPRDKFTVKTHAYYNTATLNEPIGPEELIQNIIQSLSNYNQGASAIGDLTNAQVIDYSFNNPNFLPAFNILKNNATDPLKPTAYINYLFFDDNFRFIPSLSGIIQVNTDNAWHELWTGPIPIEIDRPGYLYAFHSAEGMFKVYFDDYDLTYFQGSLLEETHYYPFGLTMGMPTSYTTTGVDQKYKFTTKELQRDEFTDGTGIKFGLEWYDYGARMQDPQIGRWSSMDPLADVEPCWSPYRAFYDNPITFIDPDGLLEYESAEAFAKANEGKTWDKDRGKGDWLRSDRENNTDIWGNANKYNLQQKDGYNQYNSIEQRAGFYGWYAVQEDLRGGETKWAGAAYIVAKQMTLMDIFYKNGDLQMLYGAKNAKDLNSFANAGNKAIFNDVFDNLRDNLNEAAKKGEAAQKWDMQTLHREQFDIVQPIYEAWVKYNPKLNNYLQEFASYKGLSSVMRMPTQLKFEGNILKAQDRYNHGMNKVVPFYEMSRKAQRPR